MRNAYSAHMAAGKPRDEFFDEVPEENREEAKTFWIFKGRPDQWPPDSDWLIWLMLGGRGAGKTHAGAAWVRGAALGKEPYRGRAIGRIALVGETFGDVRDVMIEGVSGLLQAHERGERPQWLPARRIVVWPNGAQAQAFSSEDPEALRGPQFGAAWGDAALPAPIGDWSGWIISAIFLSESGERITRTLARRTGR